MKKITFMAVMVVSIITVLLIATPKPITAKFVLAEWAYPDEYGQGIYGLKFYENSTGSWVDAPYYTDLGAFYYLHWDQTDYWMNWSTGVGVKIRVDTWINSTLTGIQYVEAGRNIQKHNVTVTAYGETVFSQQNFTFVHSSSEEAPMYYYQYSVILDFVPLEGYVYTVTITYEVYY